MYFMATIVYITKRIINKSAIRVPKLLQIWLIQYFQCVISLKLPWLYIINSVLLAKVYDLFRIYNSV